MEALAKPHLRAFSLIELMVVIGIVALLVTAGVISYKKSVISSNIVSLISAADAVKNSVESSHNQGTIFGSGSSQTYVASTDTNKPHGLYSLTQVDYGCVDLNIDLAAIGLDGTKTLILVWCPSENNGSIEWACGYDSSSYSSYLSYLPSNCQTVNTSIQSTSF